MTLCIPISVCGDQLGVKALTVEDLLQAQKEISAHNRQLKEQTKQLERDMALLRDHSLLLVRSSYYVVVTSTLLLQHHPQWITPVLLLCICVMVVEALVQLKFASQICT